jgi:hypothetical protein
MTSRTWVDRGLLLMLAGGFSLALLLQAGAQTLLSDKKPDAAAAEVNADDDDEDADTAETKQAETKQADLKDLELDWSQLNVDASTLANNPASKAARSPLARPNTEMTWSSRDKANGASDVSVKQPLSTILDARVGADMTVVNEPQTLTGADLLRQKYSGDAPPSQSSGTAWAAITGPGVGGVWDKTAVEARVDPAQDQSKLGTTLSKSLPLNEQTSLTLQNGYNVTQQGIAPITGAPSHPIRNYQADQSAKLSLTDTGTSFTAGQSLSSTDDKWLRKVGAEQKLFGGVSISGSIGETPQGPANKSLTAGFKQSW